MTLFKIKMYENRNTQKTEEVHDIAGDTNERIFPFLPKFSCITYQK